MAKKNKSDTMVAIVVIGAIILLGYFAFTYKPKADIGTDVSAIVDENGKCVGREGIDMGLCCAIWNSEIGDIEWVICEDYASPADLQAIFRLEDAPDELKNQAIISYFMNIRNTGNSAAEFRLKSISTTSDTSDALSQAEFTNAFRNLALSTTWFYVDAKEAKNFSMGCPNVIRIDLPEASTECGVQAFQVKNGTYQTMITLEFRDPINKAIIGEESRTIKQEVTQEIVSFSIDINQQ